MNQGYIVNKLRITTLLLIMIVSLSATILIQTDNITNSSTGSKNAVQTNKNSIQKPVLVSKAIGIVSNINTKTGNAKNPSEDANQVTSPQTQQIQQNSQNPSSSPAKSQTKDTTQKQSAVGQNSAKTSSTHDNMNTFSTNGMQSITNGGLTVSVTASRSSADVGQSVTFTANVFGGTPPYFYAWISLPTGCTDSGASTDVCIPTAPGTYSATMSAGDSGSAFGSGTLSFTVYSDPTVTFPSVSPGSGGIDVGQAVQLSTIASGGLTPYSYTWSGQPCSSQSVNSYYCVATSAGTFSISVQVQDANGITGSNGPVSYTVYSDPSAGTPLANPTSGHVDVGQTVSFSTSIVGGRGPYSYIWFNLPGCNTLSTSPLSCLTGSSGSFGVYVQITDLNGVKSTSPSTTYVVDSDPSIATPTPSIASGGIDVGQSVTFSTTAATGGTGSYSYSWAGLPPGCSSSNSISITCKPAGAGTFSITIIVTDTNLKSTTSGILSYVVKSDPITTVPSGTPSSGHIDINQSVTFTTTTSGGSSSYTYTWYNLPTNCVTLNTNSLTCTPTVSGTFNLYVNVTDLNGFTTKSGTLSYTILSDPTVSTPVPSIASSGIDVGQSVIFSTTTAGGTGSYSYAWYNLPTGCVTSSTNTLACQPSASGSFNVYVNVTDSNGFLIKSGILSYTVLADPTISTPTPSIASGGIDAGQPVTFSTTASGGSGGFVYSWNGLPSGCNTANSNAVICTPSGSGNFVVNVTISDSNNFQITSGNLTYNVLSVVSVTTPTTTPATSIDANQPILFSVITSGGTGFYSYTWTGLPTGCSTANSNAISCTPTVSGVFYINVTVTDSNSYQLTSSTLTYTILSDPVVNTPVATPITSVDANQQVTFSTTASGGTGVYSYVWNGIPAGCSSTNSNSISCNPTTAGTYSINVTVTDSNNYQITSGNLTFIVYSDPSVGIPTASVSSGGLDIGQQVTFTSATATGGLSPYTYTWGNLPNGCNDSGISSVVCSPTSAGTFNVYINITDANGFKVSSGILSFQILTDPIINSFTSNTTNIDLLQGVSFTVSVSNGASSYSYVWSVPVGCSTSDVSVLTCTPSATGSFTINVTVTDANNYAVNSSNIILTINSDPTVGTPTSSIASGHIDVTQQVTFTSATPTGGLSPYAYTWGNLPNGCSNSGTSTVTCTVLTVGTFNVYVNVTDANGFLISSSILSFQILSIPSINSFNSNTTSIDLGQSITFTVSVSGGSGTYSYAWNLPTGCSSVSSSFTCAPTTTGTFTVNVTVTDGNNFVTPSNNLIITIYPTLSVDSFTANRTTLDLTQLISFSVSASNGSGSYSYAWNLPTGCSTTNSNTVSCVPSTTGIFNVNVTVKDNIGFSVVSSTITITVYATPTMNAPLASPSSGIDVGQNVIFDNTLSGGFGATSYHWNGLPTGCTDLHMPTDSCTPSSTGTFYITVTIVDANGYQLTSPSLTYTIASDPIISAFTENASSIDLTQSVNFTVSVSGGVGPYYYTWYLPNPCYNNTPSFVCTPSATGIYTVNVSITDSHGFFISDILILTVYSDPTVGTPVASNASGTIDVSQTVTFTSAMPTGGLGPYTYTWGNLPNGCNDSGTSTVICTPTAAGTFNIIVTIVDSNGFKVTSSALSYTIIGQTAIASFTSNSTTLDLSQSVGFSVAVNGGTQPYSYSWNLPTGCTSANISTLVCTPSTTGPFTINVTITDANNFVVVSSNIQLTVYSDPTVGTPTASITSGGIDVGQSVTFTSVNPSGGYGPFIYSWISLPTGCVDSGASSITCSPVASGDFNVVVEVTDSNGLQVQSATLSFRVLSDPTVDSFTSNTTSIDLTQSASFIVTASNGAGSFTYAWKLPTGCSSVNSYTITCSPSVTGSFLVSVLVSDANSFTLSSGNISLSVYTDPSVDVPSASVPSGQIDVGQTVIFSSASPAGGLSPYSYTWSNLPTACNDSGKNTVSCSPSSAGTFSIFVTVTDANGFTVQSGILSYTILSALTINTPTSSVSSVDVGQSVTFSITASGGSGSYSYSYIDLPTGCSSSNASAITCSPTGAGTSTVVVIVTDSNSASVTSSGLSFTVYTMPSLTTPTPSTTTATVGDTVVFSTTSSGGSGFLTYSWTPSSTDLNCASSSTNSITCTPTTSGAFTITVTVTDSNGGSATATSDTFQVSPVQTTTTTISSTSSTTQYTTTPTSTGSTSESSHTDSSNGSHSQGSESSHTNSSHGAPGFTSIITILSIILSASIVVFNRRVKKE